MKDCAKKLIECLITEYKRTGINNFDIDVYLSVVNSNEAIEELKRLNIIEDSSDIIKSLSFTESFLQGR